MAARRPLPEAAAPFASWIVAAGVALMILGLLAMFAPALAALGYPRVLGAQLLLAGGAHGLAALERGAAVRVLLQALAALAFLAGGMYPLLHPGLGFGALALSLGLTLCTVGAVDLGNYLTIRDEIASGWFRFSAIGTVLLGITVCLARQWLSIWGLGTLLGVALMIGGMARVVVAHFASDVIRRPARYRSYLQRRAAKKRAAPPRRATRGDG